MLITAVALCLLNLIAAVSTRNLVFRSNAASMQDKAQLVASSLAGLDELTQERVAQTMEVLADLRSTRVVVTDASGRMVYDSRAEGQSKQVYFLLPEVVQALEGNDVFYCQYTGEAVESHAAAPVLYYDAPMGAVYLMAYDTDQGTLIASLEGNLPKITVLLELAVILISLLFSSAFSRRMNRVLDSIRTVRAGDYTHQLEMTGHDEVSQLAQEFNELTDRLHESEQLRRRFVSDASHELKTPLASIKLLADSILQNEMDSETVQEFVADISTEADRLTRLSARLLELTKLDAQVMQPREVVDVSGTVRQVLKMLRPPAGAAAHRSELRPGRRRDDPRHGGRPLPDCLQSGGERHRIQPPRRRAPAAGGAPGRERHPDRGGHRHRHPGRRHGPYFRTLLPGGQGPLPPGRRDRAGPFHRT